MRHEIIIVGRGGQGILFMGYILGLAASKFMGYSVVSYQSYSAETRGGRTRCELIISDEEDIIDDICVSEAEYAIIMYDGGLEKIRGYTKVFYNSGLVAVSALPEECEKIGVPATRIALEEFGSTIPANMVMLGAFALTRIVTLESLAGAVREVSRSEWADMNIKALNIGFKFMKSRVV